MTPTHEMQEFVRCKQDFSYFCKNYVWIFHQLKGMVPFDLYDFQKYLVNEYENHRFKIIRKFRQGGISTTTAIYCLWRAAFFNDKHSFVVSISDREAMGFHRIIRRAWDKLPDFLKCEPVVENQHELILETGGTIQCYTPQAGRGFSTGLLVVDEAAFIPKMDEFWARVYPTVSTGGQVVIISTVNGIGNWYHQTWQGAENGTNKFHPIRLSYMDHPDYSDPKWVEDTRAQLGEKKWAQEVLAEFLSSSNTYLSADTIKTYTESCSEPQEKRLGEDALWIWQKPKKGRLYIVGCDVSEGLGDEGEGDFACAQVIDALTLEQVAEFYSKEYPPSKFSQVIADVATLYNNAAVAVENNGLGVSVLEYLSFTLGYENIYYHMPTDSNGRKAKRGINTNRKTRFQIQEILYQSLQNNLVKIPSKRLVSEFQTWVFNPNTQKAMHLKGYYDDAIMALGFALFIREQILKNAPPYMEVQELLDQEPVTNLYQKDEELSEGILGPDFEEEDADLPPLTPDFSSEPRPGDDLLKEFGW